MLLREWKEKDLTAIAALEAECFPVDAWSLRMLEQTMHAPFSWTVLAEERGQVCGYACLYSVFDTADLMNIAVAPACRGRGIGGELVKALHQKAKERGAERMLLEVRVSNLGAIALYKKFGYEKIAVRKGYYGNGEDADIMEKKL